MPYYFVRYDSGNTISHWKGWAKDEEEAGGKATGSEGVASVRHCRIVKIERKSYLEDNGKTVSRK